MARSYQVLVLSGTLLIVLTLVPIERVHSQSALQQLQQIGGSMPNVPEVPPPTYDEEGTEAAWDITHPGWRQWQQQPNQANQAQILAMKKQQAEQQKLLEEAQKKQRQEEQRRRELEQYWNQVMAQQRQQETERQRIFEQTKQTLLVNFRVPPISTVEPVVPDAVGESQVTWPTYGQASFGQVTVATGQTETGLSAQQWRQARQYEGLVETLRQSPARQPAEDTILAQVEGERNALWTRAVSVPDLSDDAREAMALTLPVTQPKGPVPAMAREDVERVEAAAKTARTTAQKIIPKTLDCINGLVGGNLPESPTVQDAVKQYGTMLGLTKIAMAADKGGASSAIAESVDFIIGTLPFPQTQTALDGGRLYANVTFQATDRFMTDAMAAAGGTFDSETFWKSFKDDLNVWQRAVMEFVHYGPKN